MSLEIKAYARGLSHAAAYFPDERSYCYCGARISGIGAERFECSRCKSGYVVPEFKDPEPEMETRYLVVLPDLVDWEYPTYSADTLEEAQALAIKLGGIVNTYRVEVRK